MAGTGQQTAVATARAMSGSPACGSGGPGRADSRGRRALPDGLPPGGTAGGTAGGATGGPSADGRPAPGHIASSSASSSSDSEEEESEETSGSDVDEPSWISWFCNLRGNEFFCEVAEDYIEDEFNLCGLSSQVPYYDDALDMILDNEPAPDAMVTEQQHEMLESAAEMLYGLIHARYIVTTRGLATMLDKFKAGDFGRCPRALCEGQACCAVGTSDQPFQSTVKVFCPRCEDIYVPHSEFQQSIDGAYFGTTFPHLLLMTYPMYRPPKSSSRYVPRIFGFKLHPSAYGGRQVEQARVAGGGRSAVLEAAGRVRDGGVRSNAQEDGQGTGAGPQKLMALSDDSL